jgi:hypothetical protein
MGELHPFGRTELVQGVGLGSGHGLRMRESRRGVRRIRPLGEGSLRHLS